MIWSWLAWGEDEEEAGPVPETVVALPVDGLEEATRSACSGLGCGLPRFNTGRFGSSGSGAVCDVSVAAGAAATAGAAAGAAAAAAAGAAGELAVCVAVPVLPACGATGGVLAAGAVVCGAAVCPAAGPGATGALDPRCRSTGGPESSSRPRGLEGGAAFFFAAAASASVVCHFPSAIHSFVWVFCRALVTVNNPCDAPLFSASYTTSDHNAIGTGEALYADAS